jgi:hypothetical protein
LREGFCKQGLGSEHTDFVATPFIVLCFAGEGVISERIDGNFFERVERFSRRGTSEANGGA